RTVPACWEPFVSAWRSLSPQWAFDPADWTQTQVMGLVLPGSQSTQFSNGIRIIDVVTHDPTTHAVTFLPPERLTRRRIGAVATVRHAVAALQAGSSVYPPPIVQLALSPSPHSLRTSSHRSLHAKIGRLPSLANLLSIFGVGSIIGRGRPATRRPTTNSFSMLCLWVLAST